MSINVSLVVVDVFVNWGVDCVGGVVPGGNVAILLCMMNKFGCSRQPLHFISPILRILLPLLPIKFFIPRQVHIHIMCFNLVFFDLNLFPRFCLIVTVLGLFLFASCSLLFFEVLSEDAFSVFWRKLFKHVEFRFCE